MKKFYFVFISFLISQSLISQQLFINEIMASNDTTIADYDGDFTDWIEIYNGTATAINLDGYFLSDNENNIFKWTFPNVSIAPFDYLLVWATLKDTVYPSGEIHTNFKISSMGEPLIMYAADSTTLIDQITGIILETDFSYGRQPDGSSDFVFYNIPTPGYSNTANGFIGYVDPPTLIEPAGFYTNSLYLHMTSLNPTDTIYYTLDGSEPTINSNIFSDSLLLESRIGDPNNISEIQTATDMGIIFDYWEPPDGEVFKINVVRARVIKTGYVPSDVITKSYLIDPDMYNRYSLPIISLNTDSVNLFDDTIGIYVPGIGFDSVSHLTCNFAQTGMNWERKTHMELFETNGDLKIDQEIGIRIAGSASRTLNVKSLRLYARSEYGQSKFNYQFFPSKAQNVFKRLTLRTSGNDCHYTYMRDGFHHYLLRFLNVDLMQYRPSILFINGEYWGIHNIRERYNEDYIFDNYGITEDSLDYLQVNSEVLVGDDVHYSYTKDFITNNDMSDSANYAIVKTLINIDNFVDYISGNLIVCNTDWPFNNIRYWRKRTDQYIPNAAKGHDGRWRWMLYDTDYGFARVQAASYNQIQNVLNSSSYSTEFIRYLCGNSSLPGNQEFRNKLLNRICDELNTSFDTTYVLSVIDSFKNHIQPEINEHIDRWNKPGNYNFWSNIQIETKMKTFARERPAYLRGHLLGEFGMTDDVELTLDVSNINAGKIKINTKIIDSQTIGVSNPVYPWNGFYFTDIPIELTAMTKPGYNFVGWSTGDTDVSIKVVLSGDSTITAIFEIDSASISGLVINEFLAVNINDTTDEFGENNDWIELYNNGMDTINIAGLFFTDSLDNLALWQIPETSSDSTLIAPGEFILLWADGSPNQGILHLGFKLSGFGEQIGITKISGTDTIIVDSISYDLQVNDISFGSFPDASQNRIFFANTTPMASNLFISSTPDLISGLFINEFLASNDSNIVDNYGEYEDWIELFNNSTEAIDIGGLYFTDDLSDPYKYQIPETYPDSTTIQAGDFLVLWADNQSDQGIYHLGFKLSSQGEQIGVSQFEQNALYFIDTLTYVAQPTDTSYGRYTDATNNWETFYTSTPGYPNISNSMTTIPPSIYKMLDINEILVINTNNNGNNSNDYNDWIEIYNDGIIPLNLGGLYISNDNSNLTLYEIPSTYIDSTTIAPGGFIALLADNEPNQGVLHINLNLNDNGGVVYLVQIYQNDTVIIDSLSYGIQLENISYGRYPDGSHNLEHFTNITFNLPNISSYVQGNQSIDLVQNWSIFSSFIDPNYPNFEDIFANMQNDVILVKNGMGAIYYPAWAINDIPEMVVGEGYYAKMNNTQNLNISGKIIIPELTPLNLPQGWSLIGYIRQNADFIDQMLNDISANIILVKDEAGLVYWPAYTINELGYMYPGKGYLIKLTNGDILTYPANDNN